MTSNPLVFIPIVTTWEHPRLISIDAPAPQEIASPSPPMMDPIIRSRVLRYVYNSEPVTIYRLAEYSRLTLEMVKQAVAELSTTGLLKQWQDCSPYGDGRVYVGRVNRRGLAEPAAEYADSDHSVRVSLSSVLSAVRRLSRITVNKLAKQMGIPHDTLLHALRELESSGLVRLDQARIALYAISPEPLEPPTDRAEVG